uniref:Glycosyl hydrolase family 13 catalytic domain-containing protein n=1 Tax=Ananas comosus var. bracteatus TaxID=296719 RepID=A0A6V7PFA5_ANACO|nr:unnamed protein product [Ananas comosus var. bracteatus]
MAPVVFTICFRELLRDICQRYSLSMPIYGVAVENEEDGDPCVVDFWSHPEPLSCLRSYPYQPPQNPIAPFSLVSLSLSLVFRAEECERDLHRSGRMWAASCLASCCASCTCGLCSSLASDISRRSARLAYCALFALSLILSWILREVAAPLLQKIPSPKKILFASRRSQQVGVWCRSCRPIASSASRSPIRRLHPSVGVKIGSKEELQKGFSYTFRTDGNGIVKVVVGSEYGKYVVRVEVTFLLQFGTEEGLVLNWTMFTSDSSLLLVPCSQASEGTVTAKVPFVQNSSGSFLAELVFDASKVPFYLSFLLNSAGSEIRSHRKTNFCVPVGLGSGQPMPLGVSVSDDGLTNFSLFSKNAEGVILCLYDGIKDEPALEIELDPYINCTGDIWHVSLENVEEYVSYGYRCKGPILWRKGDRFHMKHVLLDPYAKVIGNFFPDHGGKVSLSRCLASLAKESAFDWSGDTSPCLPMEKLVVYRLNVGLCTKDKSSGLSENAAGTFSGLIEKIEYFKTLGVNAVLLEPIFPFDEKKGPYFPFHFFSPMMSYGHGRDSASGTNCMKEMIKSMHARGMEVLLEVVFSHTSEGGDAASQMISFRGIDNSSYYIVDGDVRSGANNSLNCNNPIVQRLILDSLHHWVVEYHVDGFCFVNSSSLVRSSNGNNLSRPPLLEAIAFDPILSKTKIIADCWSPIDMSSTEIQFPHWKKWAEMNSRFSVDVRNFLRGEALLSDLATRICGSGDLFSSRGPAYSFNYITKNFGLPLVDLVSFSSIDLASELSWNCGEEGPTGNSSVLQTRLKQIRNFLFILFVSLGVPVLNMGDECGYSNGGSPSYNDRRPFDWNSLRTGFGLQITQFVVYLSSLRNRRGDIFQRKDFLKVENICWNGSNQTEPNWGDCSCKFLSVMFKADVDGRASKLHRGDLFIGFNASDHPEVALLPEQSEGTVWLRLVDTALPFPGINTFAHTPSKEWFQTNAVLRVSLGNFLFFAIFALMMIGVKDQNDKRDAWHHGGWMAKIVFWAVLVALMFFLPNVVITIYETMSKFGSGLFLLVQVILLLDFVHTWNDAWVEKDEQKWYIALLVISVVCYLATYAFSGLLFMWFNPSGHDCGLNVFFIVMTMILAFAFAVVALHPQVNGSLLPASLSPYIVLT